MINNDFFRYSENLWITLWETCVQTRQVLDSLGIVLDCRISGQWKFSFYINNLARMTVIFWRCARAAAHLRRRNTDSGDKSIPEHPLTTHFVGLIVVGAAGVQG